MVAESYNIFKHECRFGVFDTITDWGYKPIDRSIADTLDVGHFVRIVLQDEEQWFVEKYYIEITQVDRLPSGEIDILYGKINDPYICFWYFVNDGDLLSFKKENIYEIPGWKYT